MRTQFSKDFNPDFSTNCFEVVVGDIYEMTDDNGVAGLIGICKVSTEGVIIRSLDTPNRLYHFDWDHLSNMLTKENITYYTIEGQQYVYSGASKKWILYNDLLPAWETFCRIHQSNILGKVHAKSTKAVVKDFFEQLQPMATEMDRINERKLKDKEEEREAFRGMLYLGPDLHIIEI